MENKIGVGGSKCPYKTTIQNPYKLKKVLRRSRYNDFTYDGNFIEEDPTFHKYIKDFSTSEIKIMEETHRKNGEK